MTIEELVSSYKQALVHQVEGLEFITSDLESCSDVTDMLIKLSRVSHASITEIDRRAKELAAKQRK